MQDVCLSGGLSQLHAKDDKLAECVLNSLDTFYGGTTGLRDGLSVVRVPAGAGNLSLHHRVQTGSGAHPASYPMGTRGSFPRGKAAGA
jgi:hypothetical protein